MDLLRLGADSLLVECADLTEAMALYAEANRRQAQGDVTTRDLVPAARTVLFDGVDDLDCLARELPGWTLAPAAPAPGDVVEIAVTYDGPDLAEVARHAGLTPEQVVDAHTGATLLVAFCGFLPGFAYCTGLPSSLEVPRHATPRPSVAAGSVGLAGGFTGVYPRSSPGGWQLIGRTDADLWDPAREQPALLRPGTSVRFVRA